MEPSPASPTTPVHAPPRDSAPRQVCVLAVVPFLDNRGGTELQLQSLAPHLLRHGARMRFLTCAYAGDLLRGRTARDGASLSNGVSECPTLRLPLPGILGGGVMSQGLYAAETALATTLLSPLADVIHAFGLAAVPAAMACRISGRPLVVRLVSDRTLDTLAGLPGGRRFLRLVFSADRLIAVSDTVRDAALSLGAPEDRLTVIPNGVDCQRFRPVAGDQEKADLRQRLDLPLHRPIALFVGRLDKDKAPDVLVEAWRHLSQQDAGSPTPLLVLLGAPGNDNDRRWLDDLLDSLPPDLIEQRAPVPNVEDFLRAADLFVFPSRREGMPNAVLEAAATGLPIVASSIPAIGQILDGTGSPLLPPGDSKALAETVVSLLGSSEQLSTIGDAVRERATTRHSLATAAEQTVDLYRELMVEHA